MSIAIKMFFSLIDLCIIIHFEYCKIWIILMLKRDCVINDKQVLLISTSWLVRLHISEHHLFILNCQIKILRSETSELLAGLLLSKMFALVI